MRRFRVQGRNSPTGASRPQSCSRDVGTKVWAAIVKFQATGEPPSKPGIEPLAVRGGALNVDPEINGPLVVSGNLEMCCGTGRTFDKVTSVRLCRCGGSKNKPYCDNSHRTNGFTS